jgi:hypothetical protein
MPDYPDILFGKKPARSFIRKKAGAASTRIKSGGFRLDHRFSKKDELPAYSQKS